MSLSWTIAAAGWLQVPVSSNCQTAQSVQCSLMVDLTFEAITSHKPKLWHEQHGDGCFVHHASPTMCNPYQGEATCRFMTSCFCPQATYSALTCAHPQSPDLAHTSLCLPALSCVPMLSCTLPKHCFPTLHRFFMLWALSSPAYSRPSCMSPGPYFS